MASVFLSYDHDDEKRARPIVSAVEEAGHLVWWDQRMHGGSEYNTEIETAVERADAVVVLWSKTSVRSPWVRDEAAEGRDTRKLIPVTLDGAKPPLGFRQYQTIDLSKRNDQAKANMPQLLRAIDALSGSRGLAASTGRPGEHEPMLRRAPLLWAIVALVVCAAGAALFVWRPWTRDEARTIAVSAADASATSRQLAQDLLTTLGELQRADAGGLELVGAEKRKQASFTFEVTAVADRQEGRANLVLIDERSGSLLWSKAFQRPIAMAGDLRQELSYTAAQVLRCALEAHPGGRLILKRDTLKVYLNGCAEFSDADEVTMPELLPLFRQVVSDAPRFDGGWSKLLVVEDQAYANTSDPKVKRQLTRDIGSARAVNPTLAAAYAAEMDMPPPGSWAEKLAIADRGLAANPADTWLLVLRGEILAAVGRTRDSVNDRRLAARVDPLSPRIRGAYISSLADAGQPEAALTEIQAAERLWPHSSSLAASELAFNFKYGNPRLALEAIRSGNFGSDPTRGESFLQARIDPTPAKIERALEDARALYEEDSGWLRHYVLALSIFHRQDKLLNILMSAPLDQARFVSFFTFQSAAREFWRDPRALAYASRIGLLQYWRTSGHWPDFCSEADLPYDCKKEAAKVLARSGS